MKLPIGNLKLGPLAKGAMRIGKTRSDAAPEAAARPAKPRGKRIPLNKATLALGSGVTIFAIGFVMQNFGEHPAARQDQDAAGQTPAATQSLAALPRGVDVEAITPTAATGMPADLPAEAPAQALPRDRVARDMPAGIQPHDLELARLRDADTPLPLQTASAIDLSPVLASVLGDTDVAPDTGTSAPILPCEIVLTADPAPAAMVDLTLNAACLPEERFALHHNGIMFHALTDRDGQARMRVPALAANAVFIASFNTGDGAVAQIDVPTLDFYDRVVVQWRGDAGLGLHALEFDSAYFGAGHVHAGAPGDLSRTTTGSSGVLTRLGFDSGPAALMAEVYTYPSRMSEHDGQIGLSVEAEVTAANCGQEIEAQTLQLKAGESLRTNDLTLYMPACDAKGDFLVLKNLLEDLKVAAN